MRGGKKDNVSSISKAIKLYIYIYIPNVYFKCTNKYIFHKDFKSMLLVLKKVLVFRIYKSTAFKKCMYTEQIWIILQFFFSLRIK